MIKIQDMKKYILFIIVMALSLMSAYAQTVSVDDVTIKAGETKVVSINLNSTQTNIVSFQMDVMLPDGITINKEGCALGSRIADTGQELTIGKQPDGSIRLTSTSFALTPITGTSGEIVKLSLTASNDAKGGVASLKNIVLATSNSEKLKPANTSFAVQVTYTLTYKVDNEIYKTVPVEYGTAITPEADPAMEGYTFSGWSNLPETMPNHDVEATGSFTINSYTLTYKVDGEVYKTLSVAYGSTITPEAAPTKEGYTFSGWSEIPETMPANDVTVTGTFSVNSYTLTYMVDGEEYKIYTVEFGTSITPEEEPTKEGYTFSGWSKIPETMPANDVTVTGTFSVNSYTLTYMVDGEVYKTYTVEYGTAITPEEEPTKEGYTFSGWSEIPETMPAHDVTVTGTFSINSHTPDSNEPIIFADANVKAICVANWDTNGDGELSYSEAASVTSIGEIFERNESITSFDELQFFVGLTGIEPAAFSGCYNLSSIAIPEGITTIGSHTFYNCFKLSSITIPESVTQIIGSHVFTQCNLTSIKLPKALVTIGDLIFCRCRALNSITIPASVTSIGRQPLDGCSGLTSIIVEKENTVYDSRNDCNALIETATNTLIAGCRNTTIPEGITSIGDDAFSACRELTSVTIPESVTSIGYNVFAGTAWFDNQPDGLVYVGNFAYTYKGKMPENTMVDIKDGTLGIAGGAFEDCTGLISVNIPESVANIGRYAFYGCSNLSSVKIPNNVTDIGEYTFQNCRSLTSITIPEGVLCIGDHAFYNCSNLKIVDIPSSVTSIGNGAFYSDLGLSFVKVNTQTPVPINEDTFKRYVGKLLVPKGSIEAYQAAVSWRSFKEIIEYPNPDVNRDGDENVLDVVDIARFVVGNPSQSFIEYIADINNDGSVNLGDAVVLINDIAGDQNFVKAIQSPEFIGNDMLTLTAKDGGFSLCLNNERLYTAFQLDLYVPENADVSKMMLNAQRNQKHQLLYNKVEEGLYRVAALSTSNNEFNGNEGELLNIAMNGVSGDEVSVRNILFFDVKGNDYLFDDINGSTTTSVRQIDNGEWIIDNSIYDLQGRKRSTLQRGVNIVGSKKVIVK
jgi:hypothetical protein